MRINLVIFNIYIYIIQTYNFTVIKIILRILENVVTNYESLFKNSCVFVLKHIFTGSFGSVWHVDLLTVT